MKSKKSKYDDDYVEIIIYLYLEMLEGFLNEKNSMSFYEPDLNESYTFKFSNTDWLKINKGVVTNYVLL